MRKICLLGGTGFVGKHLAHRLTKAGWQIRIPTRQREQHRELLLFPSVEMVSADVYDQEQLNAQLVGCEAVINLVGILNETGKEGTGFRKAHVEFPKKLIAACQANNIKRLLHLSALNADAKQGKSHYLRTKGEAEDLLHATEDLHVTSFRPSVIFGEDDSFSNLLAILLRVPSPVFMLPSGYAKLAPVWVEDVVDMMMQTLDNPEHYGQHYNLCGPTVYTLKEIVAYIAKLLEVKRYIIPLGKTSYLAGLVLPRKLYSVDNYLSSQTDNVCGDNNHFSEFGIKPHTIEMIMPKYFTSSTPREFYSVFRNEAHRAL
ncbi:complex I NDUFA9 subunit family protein [Candidatus Parabeggiatoa sp. HSG14]|uniref:complex I NDUFA9 subunit family protein n=1 Tax=Candidatus Parabeggiatoa sp. HSG14 TaxID=3055593 RepID=UPI0025A7CDA9|nr:complex I NDUFA9 subunit family protein [Thiotrichales bacterium HSG14]